MIPEQSLLTGCVAKSVATSVAMSVAVNVAMYVAELSTSFSIFLAPVPGKTGGNIRGQ